jgi:hypothetical protein
MKRWGITFAATAVSTYALDAVATTAGILLAASHLLGGVDHALLLVFLTGTYVVWWGLAGQPQGELDASRDLAGHQSQEYSGIVLGWARRKVLSSVGG